MDVEITDEYAVASIVGELRGIKENGFRAKSKSMTSFNQRNAIDDTISLLHRMMDTEIKEGAILTVPRFTPEEREAMERVCGLADNGADAQARSMKNVGAWTKPQIDVTFHSALSAIATVRKMLGIDQMQRMPKANEQSGPDVSIEFASCKEDICSKTAATWTRTERYAGSGSHLGRGNCSDSSDTASLGCNTGSSDTTFPVSDGH